MDLNADGSLTLDDHGYLIGSILGTDLGDADLDGVFSSQDLVLVFQAGEYEDGIVGNSTWAEGDWNCDAEFDSADLVAVFQAGGYVAGASPTRDQASRDSIFGSLGEPRVPEGEESAGLEELLELLE